MAKYIQKEIAAFQERELKSKAKFEKETPVDHHFSPVPSTLTPQVTIEVHG